MTIDGEFLRSLPYFTSLSQDELDRVESDLMERSYDRGELLFLEGDPCFGLYVVKSGMVRVFKSSPEGREQVLLVARRGDSFNDIPVFDGGTNPASAATLQSSTVLIIPKETVLSIIETCPPALHITSFLASRLRHLATLAGDLSFRSVIGRLSKVLLDTAVIEGEASDPPRLTQDEMAAMVGSVRDVIGRALRHLEKEGAVQIERGRIVVRDPDRLKQMV